MDESALIAATDAPRTSRSLVRDLRRLGVSPGDTVIVHSSMRALGWVAGGPQVVVQALMDALTRRGTLVMPTHSGQCSDPARWRDPPVPDAWLHELYASIPAYDSATTPTRGLGRIPELFRTWPGVLRSPHPIKSFAAWGAGAAEVAGQHELDRALGEGSPLARIYDRAGKVLLLGAPFASNTSCHLAEYRTPGGTVIRSAAPMIVDGERRWVSFDDIALDISLVPVGEAYLGQAGVQVARGRVGSAEALLLAQRDVVDFTVRWLSANRAPQERHRGVHRRAERALDRHVAAEGDRKAA